MHNNTKLGSIKTDAPVGRALAGWPNVNRGGIIPDITCLPVVEKALFVALASVLFAPARLEKELNIMFLEILLMPYPKYAYPKW